jgi:hypothetical protein
MMPTLLKRSLPQNRFPWQINRFDKGVPGSRCALLYMNFVNIAYFNLYETRNGVKLW